MTVPDWPGAAAESPLSGSPSHTWARAVELGARGRYAEAESLVATLAFAHGRWASLSLSMIASHRRQVGDIGEATCLDTAAWEEACDAESRSDALTGLAADAVASGDVDRAVAWHDEAATDAAQDWRTLTRWHWVGAECALLAADAIRATDHARQALAACANRSPRHEAKSRIVLAAASGEAEDLFGVSPVLSTRGWATLAWPLALVAADHAAAAPADALAEAWEAGRGATYEIERGLPEGLVPVWQAHPGVLRLRADGPVIRGE